MFTFNLGVSVCLNSMNSSPSFCCWDFFGLSSACRIPIQTLGCCFVVNPAYFMVLVHITRRIQPTSKLLMLGEEDECGWGGNWKWKPQLLSLFSFLFFFVFSFPPTPPQSPPPFWCPIPKSTLPHPSKHYPPFTPHRPSLGDVKQWDPLCSLCLFLSPDTSTPHVPQYLNTHPPILNRDPPLHTHTSGNSNISSGKPTGSHKHMRLRFHGPAERFSSRRWMSEGL